MCLWMSECTRASLHRPTRDVFQLLFTISVQLLMNPITDWQSPYNSPIISIWANVLTNSWPIQDLCKEAGLSISDFIMSATASQITDISVVYSTICSGVDQRKHQGSASLTFESGIHRWPVDSPHKGSVTRKCIYLMTSSCLWLWWIISKASCYLNHAISGFLSQKLPHV